MTTLKEHLSRYFRKQRSKVISDSEQEQLKINEERIALTIEDYKSFVGVEADKPIIFNVGCHGCTHQTLNGLRLCCRCINFNQRSDSPNLNNKPNKIKKPEEVKEPKRNRRWEHKKLRGTPASHLPNLFGTEKEHLLIEMTMLYGYAEEREN